MTGASLSPQLEPHVRPQDAADEAGFQHAVMVLAMVSLVAGVAWLFSDKGLALSWPVLIGGGIWVFIALSTGYGTFRKRRRSRKACELFGRIKVSRTGELAKGQPFHLRIEQPVHQMVTVGRFDVSLLLLEELYGVVTTSRTGVPVIRENEVWIEMQSHLWNTQFHPGGRIILETCFTMPDTAALEREAHEKFENRNDTEVRYERTFRWLVQIETVLKDGFENRATFRL